MNYRDFRGTPVAEIGLGTWQLGSADWAQISEDGAFAILDEYTQGGGNFLDTADVYGSGVSERTIGRYLRESGKALHVATKLGRRSDSGHGWPQNFGYDAMRRQVEDSLRNLGQEQLFLEQLHCIPTDTLREGKVFDHLRRLQSEGSIRHWGVSVESSEEALLCLEQDGLASLQIIFNLFRQHVADEVFSLAAQKGVALIIRVPLASGLLTGKFSESTQFASSDHRHYNADGQAFNVGETFSGIAFADGVAHARNLSSLLPDDRTAAWALRWILDHPEVTTVIPGASRPEQVQANLLASDLPPIPADAHRKLRELYNRDIRQLIRGKL